MSRSDIEYKPDTPVSGLAPNELTRPEGTPDFPCPFRTVAFLPPAPGTLCLASFQRRFATAEIGNLFAGFQRYLYARAG